MVARLLMGFLAVALIGACGPKPKKQWDYEIKSSPGLRLDKPAMLDLPSAAISDLSLPAPSRVERYTKSQLQQISENSQEIVEPASGGSPVPEKSDLSEAPKDHLKFLKPWKWFSKKTPEAPTAQPEVAPAVPQEQEVVNQTYSLEPDQSYRSIRVKIFPVTSAPKNDPYALAGDKTVFTLTHDEGIQVIRLSDKLILGRGRQVKIDLPSDYLFLDNTAISLTEVHLVPVSTNPSKICNKSNECYSYRGTFVVSYQVDQARRHYPQVVNVVDLQDYLRSVVPSEVPANFRYEAFRTQALAAKEFALFDMAERRKDKTVLGADHYDVTPTTNDQVYLGTKRESEITDRAVKSTRNQIIVYKSSGRAKLIQALYHSNSGGKTCAAWDCPMTKNCITEKCVARIAANFPYLASVRDAPGVRQAPGGVTYRKIRMGDYLKALEVAKVGFNERQVTSVVPTERDGSDRVIQEEVSGQTQTRDVSEKASRLIRRMLGLKSYHNGASGTEKTLTFTQYGYGHGIGLSQYGANIWAKQGKTAEEIIPLYYKGAQVVALSDLKAVNGYLP